jgi:hypothetical protein
MLKFLLVCCALLCYYVARGDYIEPTTKMSIRTKFNTDCSSVKEYGDVHFSKTFFFIPITVTLGTLAVYNCKKTNKAIIFKNYHKFATPTIIGKFDEKLSSKNKDGQDIFSNEIQISLKELIDPVKEKTHEIKYTDELAFEFNVDTIYFYYNDELIKSKQLTLETLNHMIEIIKEVGYTKVF